MGRVLRKMRVWADSTGQRNTCVAATTAGATVTQFVYDGDRMVAEYEGAGAVLRRYVHGPGVDEPVVWYEGATLTNRRWLLTDRQGSVIAAADSGGDLLGAPYRYGPYGEPEGDNWTGSRFRYTGQIALPEAQLYHYKARVYDPSLGRFLQTDPVGYQDDINLYAYVANDPANSSDTFGMSDSQSGCGSRLPSQGESGASTCSVAFSVPESSQHTEVNRRRASIYSPAQQAQRDAYFRAREEVRRYNPNAEFVEPLPNQFWVPRTETIARLNRDAAELARFHGPFTTEAQARTMAEQLGYVQTGIRSHGAEVYRHTRSGVYISRDRDSHAGGAWKSALRWQDLGNRNNREGTYNQNLTVRIGD